MVNDLTVISTVYNDDKIGIFGLMIESVFRFTSCLDSIIICDQGRNAVLDRYKSNEKVKIINKTPKSWSGSLGHGQGLNDAFALANTKYTAIVESDCVILDANWFKTNKKMLAAKKAKDLYHVCFLVFETDCLKGMDFRPGADDNKIVRAYKPDEDVGWRIKERVQEKDVEFTDFIDCKTGRGQIFDGRFQSDEFWLSGRPIVAHFGRGSNLDAKAVRKNFESHEKQLEEWKNIAEKIVYNK